MNNTPRYTLHKADSRGHANHGWLNSYHSFSFGGYYHPERIHFGALRVLNDDTVAAGMGFSTHPHDNMEIISIPTFGDLRHRDNTGNDAIIKQGDIQVMSAGTGIAHSEMNANRDKEVRFFQIWIFPNQKNVTPRYDQYSMDLAKLHNNLAQVLSPNADDEGVWIHQDAWFHLGHLDAGFSAHYQLKQAGNGVYAFVIEGDVTINGHALNRRDGLGIENVDSLDILADSHAQLLLMEVPMQ
ncbi:MAG: pirin family protein [Chitinophagaceae bacterium]|nr:pirin family protein [Chitinophagaceae bacterium]